MIARFIIGLSLLATPAAALAASGVPVPEGSQFTLFALGLLGVIIGRRASMRPPGED
ncbi:MAG: hypothetical protein ACXU61_01570 [Croceibacterium sp.]